MKILMLISLSLILNTAAYALEVNECLVVDSTNRGETFEITEKLLGQRYFSAGTLNGEMFYIAIHSTGPTMVQLRKDAIKLAKGLNSSLIGCKTEIFE